MRSRRYEDEVDAILDLIDPLSETELRVLQEMVRGAGNEEIALSLGMGLGTLKTHVHRIITILHARNRNEAIYTALVLGIATLGKRKDALDEIRKRLVVPARRLKVRAL